MDRTIVPNVSSSKQVPSVPVESRVLVNLQAEIARVGLPITVLARKLEVSEKQLQRWRSGKNVPNYASVEQFARYFEREPEWFFLDHSEDEVAA